MSGAVITKTYPAPPVNEREILRYAGCAASDDEATIKLMKACLKEAERVLTYKTCRCFLPLEIRGNTCDFKSFSASSGKLAKNLCGCTGAVLFSATVGAALDRLIAREARLSPSRAVMLQAIGAERVEALCDALCAEIAEETGCITKPRFSPGYGDLSLSVQKDIFAVLSCPKNIGVCLNDSLLMSPSKSVTAFVGIGGNV